ncbi:helix-turn-helix transcriptional regulator [Streptomyces spongiae]|uniref:HTH luxR-type domain-containing protein n=1 Tax=Streptomyces spongiae TaxID=565072 RepID=A0A5N8XWB8_9ACTN|nr:LuxR family transcriptional regulator [Streptomyces spongiae]MPY63368.1 hypothetical protein [Streptomyces spongiae]
MSEAGLHGRESEKRRLSAFLTGARHGRSGSALVIDGFTGVGKSRLLRETAHRARQQGFSVHWSAGELRERAAASGSGRRRAGEDRSLLVLDDVETVPAGELHHLVGSSRADAAPWSSPTLLLARGANAPGLGLEQLYEAHSAPVDRLELAPLPSEAVRSLVRDLIGVDPREGLLDVANCAGGNPRLVVQLVRGLLEEGRVGPEGELVRLTPGQLPLRVRTAVDARLRLLSKESVQLLRVGTILGRTFQLPQAAAMLGTSAAALLSALDEPLAAGILAFTDEGLSFQQPLVWRGIYETIPESVRTTLHLEARRITAEPAPPDHDMAALGRVRTPRPARPPRGAVGADTRGALRTLLEAGHVTSAVQLVGSVLNGSVPAREKPVLRRMVTDIAMSADRFAVPIKAGEDADLADVELLAHAHRKAALDRSGEPRGAEPELYRAAAVALSNLAWAEGVVGEAVRRGREAVEQSVTPRAPRPPSYPRLALAYKLIALDEADEATGLCRQAHTELSEEEPAVLAPAVDLVEAAALIRGGDLEGARQRADGALSTAEGAGLDAQMTWAAATLCLVAIRSGDLTAAARHLARCRELEAGRGATSFFAARRQWLDVLLYDARNELREAAGLLATSHAHLPSLRPLLLEEPGAAAWFVRFSRRTGDRGLGEACLRAAERLAADNPGTAAITVAADHARSLYECDADGLARAAAGHQDAWARTCATQDLEALLRERRVDRRGIAPTSPTPRRATWTVRDHIGRMTAVEAPVPTAEGEPTGKGGPAGGVESDPTENLLGTTERSIAALVAEGLTNRQVAQKVHLSPHTVNYYLRRIYGKLGINSRVELARRVHHGRGGFA